MDLHASAPARRKEAHEDLVQEDSAPMLLLGRCLGLCLFTGRVPGGSDNHLQAPLQKFQLQISRKSVQHSFLSSSAGSVDILRWLPSGCLES